MDIGFACQLGKHKLAAAALSDQVQIHDGVGHVVRLIVRGVHGKTIVFLIALALAGIIAL